MTAFEHFEYQNNQLFCEKTDLNLIAEQQGTPLYVYSYQAILDQYNKLDQAFKSWDHQICFAVKANTNKAIMKILFDAGSGADVVSGGELRRAIEAGCDPQKIVFSGVGKTAEEIHLAMDTGLLQFNCESEQELENIQRVAAFLDKKAPVSIRVNPNVDPKTHPYISTGLKKNKFGVSHTRALELYLKAKDMSHIDITGISCHIGSQIVETGPFKDAMIKVAELVKQLKENGITLKNIDVGGGLGIRYNDEKVDTVETYAQNVMAPLKDLGCKILMEPGRFIVGNAGVLLTKVVYLKQGEDNHHFTIIDAAFNDLSRPMLYKAYHEIRPVVLHPERGNIITNLEGPICETTDCFAKDREIETPEQGEYLAIMSAGAYAMSMASTYNSRGRPTEILVKGDKHYVIKKRDRLEDITMREALPEFMKN